jgi:hypothetical protein
MTGAGEEEGMSARQVVVVMPFGGRDRIERRRAILNFKRLDYLVLNRCKVKYASAVGDAGYVAYDIEVCRTAMDEIPEQALRQIHKADILIALIAGPNPNVIYEVAYRRALHGKLILLVDSPDDLPLYLKTLAHLSWKQENVLKRIDRIANDDLPDLSAFAVAIPNDLKEAIDIHDGELQRGLEEALKDIESQFVPEPSAAVMHLREIVSDETSSFYPWSIVEVEFSRRGEYANPLCPGIVQEFDDAFARLYGYSGMNTARADRPLTLQKLLKRIEGFSDAADWGTFMEEQISLTNTVVKEYGFARVTVPLRINERHPREEFKGTSYLPCLIAQVIDGNVDGSHKMYLLVVYIEIPNTLRPGRHPS